MMASGVRRAALLLLPPVSALLVIVIVAVRWLCRRRLLLLAASFPSRGPVERLPPVALYYRRMMREAAECVFCLSAIEDGSEVRELRCRHLFHRPCLDRWLHLARPLATCPLCRRRLLLLAWEEDYDDDDDVDSDSDMMLFMACVHSRSTWFWPSS